MHTGILFHAYRAETQSEILKENCCPIFKLIDAFHIDFYMHYNKLRFSADSLTEARDITGAAVGVRVCCMAIARCLLDGPW